MRGRLEFQDSVLSSSLRFCPGLSASAARAPCTHQAIIRHVAYWRSHGSYLHCMTWVCGAWSGRIFSGARDASCLQIQAAMT